MNIGLFSFAGFALTAPLLLYAAYSIRRDSLRWRSAMIRLLKWIAISLPLALAVNVALLFRSMFASVAIPVTAPVFAYIVYSIWRDKLGWRPAMLRLVKWSAISLPAALVVSAAIFMGTMAILASRSCDDMTSSAVANSRGDRAQGHLRACFFFGASDNYYITFDENQLSLWPEKKLIDYDPVDDRDPVLRWIDDNTLSVDLGKVYWVSSTLDKVGSVQVIYSYEMVDSPYKDQS